MWRHPGCDCKVGQRAERCQTYFGAHLFPGCGVQETQSGKLNQTTKQNVWLVLPSLIVLKMVVLSLQEHDIDTTETRFSPF